MRSFDELLAEACAADVGGWDFGFLEGRASEERPPWGYAGLLAQRLATVASALDLDTGGGEILSEATVFPARMAATESWPPNAERARQRLGHRGVDVLATHAEAPLPFPNASFELVTSRHPVRPDWLEIHRVLKPGGHYFAQHVGPASAFELIERFLGPLPEERRARDPQAEVEDAQRAGLVIKDLRTARCRMEFFDVGAVVTSYLRRGTSRCSGFAVQTADQRARSSRRPHRGATPNAIPLTIASNVPYASRARSGLGKWGHSEPQSTRS